MAVAVVVLVALMVATASATQDIVIDVLHEEEGHLRLFEGFLREFVAEGEGFEPSRRVTAYTISNRAH